MKGQSLAASLRPTSNTIGFAEPPGHLLVVAGEGELGVTVVRLADLPDGLFGAVADGGSQQDDRQQGVAHDVLSDREDLETESHYCAVAVFPARSEPHADCDKPGRVGRVLRDPRGLCHDTAIVASFAMENET